MLDITRKLVDLLNVSATGVDHFQGDSEDLGFPNVFGGQVLGQALMAASRTVEDRLCHSLHAYFLRPGNQRMPIDYEVERVRDGGSFSVRRVTEGQEGKEILTCYASFQSDEAGLEHQFEMPKVPAPETLKTEQELGRLLAPHVSAALRPLLTRDRPVEFRPVAPGDPLHPKPGSPRAQDWVRVRGTLPDDPVLHRCLLAYASDFSFLGTSLVPHGIRFWDAGLRVASLDHAMWFHSNFRMDEWLLYDKDSPSAAAGRGFNRGSFYNASGDIVASCTQECLIRLRKGQ